MSDRSLLIGCSNRSEYGLLRPLLTRLADPAVPRRNIGSHSLMLFSEAAASCRIDATRDQRAGTTEVIVVEESGRRGGESVGEHFARLTAAFGDLARFDGVLLPGDRYETFALACRSFFGHLPIFHLFGGDISNGGHFDDHLRHAVSHLAALHFPVNRVARANLVAMHQEPSRIFHVGSPVVDEIADVMASAGEQHPWTVILSFNPMTLGPPDAVGEALVATLEALDALAVSHPVTCLGTRPNREPGSNDINDILDRYSNRAWLEVRDSLGSPTYLHAIRSARLVIGNSSSQLLEVPVVGTHSLLIGDRQKGRYEPDTVRVLPGRPSPAAIGTAIAELLGSPRPPEATDYGRPGVSDRIIRVIDAALAHARSELVEKSTPLQIALDPDT